MIAGRTLRLFSMAMAKHNGQTLTLSRSAEEDEGRGTETGDNPERPWKWFRGCSSTLSTSALSVVVVPVSSGAGTLLLLRVTAILYSPPLSARTGPYSFSREEMEIDAAVAFECGVARKLFRCFVVEIRVTTLRVRFFFFFFFWPHSASVCQSTRNVALQLDAVRRHQTRTRTRTTCTIL